MVIPLLNVKVTLISWGCLLIKTEPGNFILTILPLNLVELLELLHD